VVINPNHALNHLVDSYLAIDVTLHSCSHLFRCFLQWKSNTLVSILL